MGSKFCPKYGKKKLNFEKIEAFYLNIVYLLVPKRNNSFFGKKLSTFHHYIAITQLLAII